MRTVLTILATLTVLAAIGACTSTPPATGPVAAIDHVAREFFDWGAATQPGSPAAAVRDAIATSAHADHVRSCIVA